LNSSEEVSEITPAIAMWLGWQAARTGRTDEGRALVPDEVIESYDKGVGLPDGVGMICPAPEALRRRLMRRLGGDPEPRKQIPPLTITISELVRRPDIGTGTRYNVTLQRAERKATLRDLVASDLLTWSHLRPIALDAGMVLANLEQGQVKLWLAEVERAMDSAQVVPLLPEESEAGEIIDLLSEAIDAAQLWEWAEEDPYPRGVARIEWQGMVGWTRGPIQDALRARLGKVSRVALSRSLAHLGLARLDWRIETAYVRVWARKAVKP